MSHNETMAMADYATFISLFVPPHQRIWKFRKFLIHQHHVISYTYLFFYRHILLTYFLLTVG